MAADNGLCWRLAAVVGHKYLELVAGILQLAERL
jgi:hypothetical protein